VRSKIFGLVGTAAVIGVCAFSPAAYAQYDNTNDTVHCETVIKGSLKFKPALNNVDQGPALIKVSGTLGACTSPSHPALVFPEGKSKFKGLLTSPTSGCLGLLGPSGATGDLTFTFNATDGPGGPGLLLKTTVLHIPAGGSLGGTVAVGGGTYGQFGLGTPNGAGALSLTSGGFTGGNGGATSGGLVVTQQAVGSLGTACALAPPLGIKAINIGLAQIDLQ
jgi:hypothetical protein